MSFNKWINACRALAVAIVLLIVFVSVGKQLRREQSRGDVEVYVHAARLVLAGQDIYATPESRGQLYYLYPPLLAVLVIPLVPLPGEAVILLWCLLNIFLAWWVVAAFYAAMTKESFFALPVRTRWIISFFSLLLSLRSILYHLDLAQANIAVMAVAVFGLWLLKRDRKLWAGALIGASVVLKVLTLPLLPLLVGRREWRLLAGVVAGIVAALLLPALFVGFERNLSYLDYWFNHVLLSSDLHRNIHWPVKFNYSLASHLYRFFGDAPAFEHNGHLHYFTLFRLSNGTLHQLGRLITLLTAGVIAFYGARYRRASELVGLWGGVALAFSLVPVFSPVAQKHYYVMLLPAHVYVVHLWFRLGLKDRWFRGLVVASFVVSTLSTNLFGYLPGAVVSNLGGLAGGAILLAAAIFRAAHRLTEEQDADSTDAGPA